MFVGKIFGVSLRRVKNKRRENFYWRNKTRQLYGQMRSITRLQVGCLKTFYLHIVVKIRDLINTLYDEAYEFCSYVFFVC